MNKKFSLKRHLKRNGRSNKHRYKENKVFWVDFIVITIIPLNKFSNNNVILLRLLKKIIPLVKKKIIPQKKLLKKIRNFIIFVLLLLSLKNINMHDLFSLLHLQVTNTYTYKFNLYKKKIYKISFVFTRKISIKYC